MGYISNSQLKQVQEKIVDNLKDGVLVPSQSLSTKSINPVSEESGTIQDTPFISQGTGTANNTTSVDTSPVAKQLEKQGNTVVTNQLFRGNVGSWNTTVVKDGTKFTATTTAVGGYANFNVYGWTSGHKYLVSYKFSLVDETTVKLRLYADASTYVNEYNASSKQLSIFTADRTPSGYMMFGFYGSTANTSYIIDKIQVYDLTMWFNGDIPQDVLDNPSHFSWYSNISNDRNDGTLTNTSGRYLVCMNRQLWDEVTELGYIDATGNKPSSSNIRSKNYIEVIPNRSLYMRCPTASVFNVFLYDNDKQYITVKYPASGSVMTVPQNTRFIRFYLEGTYGTTYKHDITISLYYSPEEGGEGYSTYYPYQEPNVYDTGTEELLAFDTKVPSGVIERGTINQNLGDLTWVYQSSYEGKAVLRSTDASGIKGFTANLKCPKYVYASTMFQPVSKDKTMAVAANGQIYIQDSAYTDASTFKTAMNGVYLQAEASTKTIEQGTPFSENIEIDDYGMMYWLDTNNNLVDIPQGVKLFYPADYVLYTDTLYTYTDGDPEALVLNGELASGDPDTLKGMVDLTNEQYEIMQTNAGGTLRNILSTTRSVPFNSTKAIPLDSLTFSYVGGWNGFQADISDYVNEYAAGNSKPFLVCSGYACGNYQESAPCIQAWTGLGTNAILIKDTSLGTDPTSDTFKNGIKGMILAYKVTT